MVRLINTNTVPIGDAIVRTLDTAVGSQTREELFAQLNPNVSIIERGRDHLELKHSSRGAEEAEDPA
jgi:hypothetical protein